MLEKVVNIILKEEENLKRRFVSNEQKDEVMDDFKERKPHLDEILEQRNVKGFQQTVNRKYRKKLFYQPIKIRKICLFLEL